MLNWLRSPLIASGLFLVVLGLGNWHTGISKGAEYGQRLRSPRPPASEQQVQEFEALDPETNSMLLRSLDRRRDPYAFVHDKLDFYEVVNTGGRLLVLLGMFLTVAGFVQRQRGHVEQAERAAPIAPSS